MTEWVEIGPCRLACGDCLEILPELEAGGVDAVVTDPPYGIRNKFPPDVNRHGGGTRTLLVGGLRRQ